MSSLACIDPENNTAELTMVYGVGEVFNHPKTDLLANYVAIHISMEQA